MKFKIDFGCGPRKKNGFIGVDIVSLPEVDVIADLNKGLPFKSESVDEIFSSHTLEHLDNPVFTLEEFHRILRNEGRLELKLPHFTNAGGFNPFHKHFFSITWLDVTDTTTDIGKIFSFTTKARFRIVKRYILLQKHRLFLWLYFLEYIINRSYKWQQFYECFLSFIFPASETHWSALKIKNEMPMP
jgi:SAM-dependent methyltransferase